MRRIQKKKLSIAPAGSEGEAIRDLHQYLHQQKMQMKKQPAADVDLTFAGMRW
jgi:hypothetical protein